ncbi:hypothetical protein HP550_02375 [Cellulomonas humilata]|uniref:Uncharacterized protein n=1 Tax=Cellulomonas humilata TaxID=144055 RepID=A0A7Y5ZZ04_9CELL|nr:hypothetical protein [Cellulomonas humilata]NUU16098.1 hypothetical protein [Cellulomonas humilata]
MSTSDPHRPGGATDRPDETDPAIEQTTPGADDAPAHEVAPTVETLDPPTPTEAEPGTAAEPDAVAEPAEPAPAEPIEKPVVEPVEPDAAATETLPAAARTTETTGPSLDTGRHAVVRPAPTPPDEPTPDPVVTPTAAAERAEPTATTTAERAEPTAAPTPEPLAPEPAPVTAAAPVTPVAPAAPAAPAAFAAPTPAAPGDDDLFPDPNAPRSTSVGSHILGVLVGLILGPIGAAVLLIGEAQILDAQVDGWDASTEVLGIVLVTLGVLLLGTVLLLGLWTPAVPITAGTVLTLAGIVYLYLPSIAREQTLNLLTSSGWRLTVTQVTVAGTSGMVLATGFLLLLAGIVIGAARRRGVHLGEFRERHRV